MKQTANFLWIGPELSKMEQLCLRSFLHHGYDVRLHTYGPVAGVPEGVVVESASSTLPIERVFVYGEGFGKGSYAGFSDVFRYELLYQRGAWWFDLDFVSIKPKPAPKDLLVCTSHEGEWGARANACALYAPPRHPFLARLRDEAQKRLAAGPVGFGDIGPVLVQRIVEEMNLFAHLAPWWEFSPYPWRQINRVALPDFRAVAKDRARFVRHLFWQFTRSDFRAGYIRSGTRAIHLHNEIWRSSGMDKNAPYHPLCLYERLKRRHGVA
jgi:hypothetical protein